MSGDHKTIADLSILASLSFIEILGDYNFREWKNVSFWMQKLKAELPYYKEINDDPLKATLEFLKNN